MLFVLVICNHKVGCAWLQIYHRIVKMCNTCCRS